MPALKLYLPQSALAKLNKDLPDSGREYVKGELVAGGKRYRIKAKYRGDNIYHWGTVQKSWRVKLKKGKFYDGMRALNLINPFALTINDPLVWSVGQRMGGLHVPKSYPVNVFLNGNFLGVFALVEQINEYWARHNDLLPGDIYYGEGMWSRELYDKVEKMRAEGVPLEEIKDFRQTHRVLWNSTAAWDKNASVNSDTKNRTSPRLKELLQTVVNPDDGFFRSHIWDLMDRDMLLRAIALHLILDSRHTDDGHNWKLYLNPYRSRFEPVLWNLACLQYYDKEIPDDFEIERFGQLLYDRAMSDPMFLSDLCEFIYGFVWRDLTPDGLVGIFDELIARVRPSVRADEFKDQWLDERAIPLSNREFERVVELSRKRLKSNLDKVLAELRKDRVDYSLLKGTEAAQVLIRFKTKAGLVLDRIDLVDSQGKHPTGWKLYLDLNDDGLLGQEDRLLGVSENGVVATGPQLLLSNRTKVVFNEMASLDRKVYRTSQTLPTHCRLLVARPDGAGGELAKVWLNLLNRATGEAVPAEPDRNDPDLRNSRPMSQDYSNPKPAARELVVFGKGVHRITEDRVYGKGQDLVFEPGAVMEMAEGASIVVHGSLKILGTESEPVVFCSAGTESWGVLAVQSPVAEVVVRYLRMSGGSEGHGPPGLLFGDVFRI